MTTGRKGLQQAQAAGDDGDMPTSLTGAAGAIKIDPSTEEAAKESQQKKKKKCKC